MTIGGMGQGFRRGINFGNALDTARGVEPPWRLDERYFDTVRAAGFDTVRLPVRWSAHAAEAAPFTIDTPFFERVDRTVDGALRRDLTVVLDLHHYDELQRAPREHETRFIALWEQIARRYADRHGGLCFELLNEPRDAMTATAWNRLLPRALAAVRAGNPDRTVVVGPVRQNDLDALGELNLPDDDNLVATIHYYAPLTFTHQGAQWTAGADRWLGTTWGGDAGREAVRADFAEATTWARQHGRALFIGEFGTYDRADLASRLRWTRCVRAEAERHGLTWCYWDFATDFGVFDPRRDTWREPLLRALIPTADERGTDE